MIIFQDDVARRPSRLLLHLLSVGHVPSDHHQDAQHYHALSILSDEACISLAAENKIRLMSTSAGSIQHIELFAADRCPARARCKTPR